MAHNNNNTSNKYNIFQNSFYMEEKFRKTLRQKQFQNCVFGEENFSLQW